MFVFFLLTISFKVRENIYRLETILERVDIDRVGVFTLIKGVCMQCEAYMHSLCIGKEDGFVDVVEEDNPVANKSNC